MLINCRLSVLLFVCAAAPAAAQPAAAPHPLDPLSAQEIEAAAKIVGTARGFPDDARFATLVLEEPPKADVLASSPGASIPRQAFAIVLDRKHNRTFEAVADVKAGRLVSWTEIKGVQPAV